MWLSTSIPPLTITSLSKMATEGQTPRRSKRYQPIVLGASSSKHEQIAETTPLGEPIYSRTTRPEDLHEEDEFEEDARLETRFYDGISIRRPKKPTIRRGDDSGAEEEKGGGDSAVLEVRWERKDRGR